MRRKHKLRALRNLAVTVLCLLLIWAESGYPLPTQEMEFRRAERQMLAGQSTIIWSAPIRSSNGRPGSYYSPPDAAALVGVTPTSIHTYDHDLTVWPRVGDRPTLIVLPNETVLWSDAWDGGTNILPLMVIDPPPNTQTARLTIDIPISTDLSDPLPCRCTAEAQRDGQVFFLPTEPLELDRTGQIGYSYPSPEMFLRYPYTLEFFDTDGKLVTAVTSPGK